jgi:hypothetical protein
MGYDVTVVTQVRMHGETIRVAGLALKPVLYGTIVARLARVPSVVNALAGLGYVFSSRAVCTLLAPRDQNDAWCVIVLVGRMLRDKGVGEFVEAARILRAQGTIARSLVVSWSAIQMTRIQRVCQ